MLTAEYPNKSPEILKIHLRNKPKPPKMAQKMKICSVQGFDRWPPWLVGMKRRFSSQASSSKTPPIATSSTRKDPIYRVSEPRQQIQEGSIISLLFNIFSILRKTQGSEEKSPSIPVAVLDLDEDDPKPKQESENMNKESKTDTTGGVEKDRGDDGVNSKGNGVSSSSAAIPCIDRLREELSCAICLEICYEPSTTSCGHSNGRYCTVNTVLWNTIQLLFPQDVEARKGAADAASDRQQPQQGTGARTRSHSSRNRALEALNSPESESRNAARRSHSSHNRAVEALNSPESESRGAERRSHRTRSRISRPSGMLNRGDAGIRTALPSQNEDTALALRLQREEFMEAFRVPEQHRSSFAVARANLRAMASRAINIRIRGRTD
ncbi:UNVERIFIED_CONTAM: hypothetical protein Slati_1631400 [Sesamum latifolium]|uniref:RING-type E3 ubiquitin transferase n=1 Tax=Sesamum latifolium TaxID=2727402 RepID=A0AAW2XFP0_9LAMI